MTASVPTKLPSELIAGDTWQWTRDYANYPAGTWAATVYLEKDGAQISATATVSGLTHSFSIPAATTAGKKAGRYKWWVRVTDGTNVTTVEDGWLNVLPDPAATGTRDHRSWARRTLDAVESFLEGNASTAQQSMTVNGRALTRWALPELLQLRDKLRAEVRTEERGESAGLGRNIKVRFGRG